MTSPEQQVVEESVRFPSQGLSLEGVLSYPGAGDPAHAILLLNPHPHFGGNMRNNVIRSVAQRASSDGAVTLRFNYRGVGDSEIRLVGETCFEHWDRMERERRYDELVPDCLAAAEYLGHATGMRAAVIVGYSLGAILAGMIAHHDFVQRIVALSPPIARVPLTAYGSCSKPKLFVVGDRDVFASRPALEAASAELPQPTAIVCVANGDHFFRQQESTLYEAIRSFLFGSND